MTRRILIEGMMPYRALNRLQKAGIGVENVRKRKKNAVICTIDEKDAEKVFAIYPNVCYNNGKYTPYTARLLPDRGLKRAWKTGKKRVGLFLGAAAFLAVTAFSDTLVLRIEVVGETAYTQEVEEILAANRVQKFRRYREEDADLLSAQILRLEGVSFCSVKKVGSTLVVEVQTSPFASAPDPS